MTAVRDADIVRVLLTTCEAAARGLEAAAALVADRVNLGGIIEEHAARHLRLCGRLERLVAGLGDESEPGPGLGRRGGVCSSDAVVLQACRDLEERTDAAYRLALEVTESAELRVEIGSQYDQIRRLRVDIDALHEPVLGSPI